MLQSSVELAYWIGLVQADGSLTYKKLKNGNIQKKLTMSSISKTLIKEFQKGLKFIDRFPTYYRRRTIAAYGCDAGVNKVANLLDNWNIIHLKKFFKPTEFITKNKELFGSYLAGVIDGDGDIRIKRKKYPQCVIRISSGSNQPILISEIKKFFNCAVSETKRIRHKLRNNKVVTHTWYELEFLVSSKNIDFILNFLLPNIKLDYKRNKIISFLNKSNALAGI